MFPAHFAEPFLEGEKTICLIAKTMSDIIQTMSDMIQTICLVVFAVCNALKTRCRKNRKSGLFRSHAIDAHHIECEVGYAECESNHEKCLVGTPTCGLLVP